MAAAVEHMRSADHQGSSSTTSNSSSSPSRRSKLVLPTLTPAMQQDLASAKGSSSAKKLTKPLSFGTRPEFAEYPLNGIVTPHPNDVLCGRGGGSNNHPGNESFRELVNEVKYPYVNCPKREKPLIARRIVEAVRNQTPPGRFLSKDSKTGLWNDIGDGKAREKTSQALREGAPIIRDMVNPTSPTNVAIVLKEAKKAERAEKEYGVKLPKRSPQEMKKGSDPIDATAQAVHEANTPSHPTLPKMNKPTAHKRGKSMSSSPSNVLSNNVAPVPSLKNFQDMSASSNNGQPSPASAWTHISQHPAGRNFNMMPYGSHHSGQQLMGGFASPYGNGMQSRYPMDSVPMETVRRLLLGQLDPVQLALQLLPPEEAAIVARRHVASTGLAQHPGMMGVGMGPPPGSSPTTTQRPSLPSAPMVSDGSSTSCSSADLSQITSMQRTHSDQSAAAQGGGGDDGSSVGSKQSNNSERALPKKKRKYVQETV
ncbi:hypothetical protein ACHAXR_007608 [Thalassiosira sp. AJA248-18]